jgi:hypothetical protein
MNRQSDREWLTRAAIIVVTGFLLAGRVPAQGNNSVDDLVVTEPYAVQASDTLEDLAERFMGSPEYADELLQFNNLTREEFEKNKDAQILVYPGALRSAARDALRTALLGLNEAKAAEAPTYAKKEFGQLMQMCQRAAASLKRAAYDSTIKNGTLAVHLGKKAIAVADNTARIQLPLKIIQVHGVVESAVVGSDAWSAHAQAALSIGHALRTATGSRVLIEFPNATRILVEEESELVYEGYLFDQRDKTFQVAVSLVKGAVTGVAPALEHTKDAFVLSYADVKAPLNDNEFQVRLAEETYASSWLRPVNLLVSESEVELKGHQGHHTSRNAVKGRQDLLPTCTEHAPADNHISANQQPEITWQGKGESYRVEIAEDPEFVTILQRVDVETASYTPAVLKQGVYYYRVFAIGDKGVFSFPTLPYKLTIAKDLAVAFKVDRPWFTRGEDKIISSAHQIIVRPPSGQTSVVAMEYKLDDQPYVKTDGVITLPKEGPQQFAVRGISAEGDVGTAITARWVVDHTPPTRRMLLSDDPKTGDVILVLNAEDNTKVERIEYRLDDGELITYKDPIRLPADPVTLSFRAIDVVGNASLFKSISLSDQ